MRLDPDHVAKLKRSITTEDDDPTSPVVSFDIEFMIHALDRLSLWERGLVTNAIIKASRAKRLSVEQRALLALFVGSDDDAKEDRVVGPNRGGQNGRPAE